MGVFLYGQEQTFLTLKEKQDEQYLRLEQLEKKQQIQQEQLLQIQKNLTELQQFSTKIKPSLTLLLQQKNMPKRTSKLPSSQELEMFLQLEQMLLDAEGLLEEIEAEQMEESERPFKTLKTSPITLFVDVLILCVIGWVLWKIIHQIS